MVRYSVDMMGTNDTMKSIESMNKWGTETGTPPSFGTVDYQDRNQQMLHTY